MAEVGQVMEKPVSMEEVEQAMEKPVSMEEVEQAMEKPASMEDPGSMDNAVPMEEVGPTAKITVSTPTHDSKGNTKWEGLKSHVEKLLEEKPDTVKICRGFDEFEERVGLNHIQPGYIIYMARTLEDTSGGKKIGSVDPLGLLTDLLKKMTFDRKYIFSHVAIYVGEWEGTHYFVENGGPDTGKEFLSKKSKKDGYHSAIQIVEAKKVISSSPFIAMTVPWGKMYIPEDEREKKRKIWPNQEELLQKALAAVGFPFNYDIRTRSCETFTLLLIGIGEIDSRELFPQLGMLPNSWISKRYAGSPEVTEEDLAEVQKFQKDFKSWFSDLGQHIDRCEYKVEGGKVKLERWVPKD